MATVEKILAEQIPAEGRTVLRGVPWRTYAHLRKLPENYHLRMTYDRGTLEIMSPSPKHEGAASIIARLIAVWTEELNIPIRSLGEMTCSREDIDRGFEPDKCYYVQNEPRMWDKMEINLSADPPPDLAIEVEISRSSVNKMDIYAAFGVPELWRLDRRRLRVYELVEGNYHPRESSLCFPQLPIAQLQRVLGRIGKVRETELIRGFCAWVRKNFVPEGD
jgi:Uma2 family endonuclease